MSTQLEHCPNEILLDIFEYVDTRDLFHGFWRLNQRFDHLLQSLKQLSLTMETNESKLVSFFGHQISRLVVNTCLDINFSKMPYLRSLVLYDLTETHFQQIRTQSMPSLVHLSIPSNNTSWFVEQLIQRIFSSDLSSLITVHLGSIWQSMYPWSQSYSLRSLSVCCIMITTVNNILLSCPHLSSLRVQFEDHQYSWSQASTLIVNHPLQHFILSDPSSVLKFTHIDGFLQDIPNIQRIRLNFKCDVSFIHFAQTISKRLPYLRRFDCHIDMASDDEMSSIETIQRIHPCFSRMEYTTDDIGYRTYTTH